MCQVTSLRIMETGNSKTTIEPVKSSPDTPLIQELGPYDILCGRGKTAFHNIVNRRFRVTMSMNLDAYMNARCKIERSVLIATIVANLTQDVGARFLKPQKSGGGYIQLNDAKAREKVAHALRDMCVAKRQTTVTEWSKKSQKREDTFSQIRQAQIMSSLKIPPPTHGNEMGYLQFNQEQQNGHFSVARKQQQQQQQQQDQILQWQQNRLKSMLEEERVVPNEAVFDRFSSTHSMPERVIPNETMFSRFASAPPMMNGGIAMGSCIDGTSMPRIWNAQSLESVLSRSTTTTGAEKETPPSSSATNNTARSSNSIDELRNTSMIGEWDKNM